MWPNFDFLVDSSLTYNILTVASFRIRVPSILFFNGIFEIWYDFKFIWIHCVSRQGRAFDWRVAGLGWMTHVRRLDNQIYMEQIKKFSAPNIATTCCNKVIELFNPLNSILCKLSCPIHGFLARIILRCLLWCNSELKI